MRSIQRIVREAGLSRRGLLRIGAGAGMSSTFWLATDTQGQQSVADTAPLQIDVREISVSAAEIDLVARQLGRADSLRGAAVSAANRRVLSVQAIDPDESAKARAGMPTTEWRAVIYDYASQQALIAEGSLGSGVAERVRTVDWQPIPSPDEWQAAREVVEAHPEFGPAIRSGGLIAYRPMPPVVLGGEGRRRRLVTVGLLPPLPIGGRQHEIVGVDLGNGTVQRYAARAPETAIADHDPLCGASLNAYQPTTGQGTPGQYALTIRRGNTVYWTLTVVRPSASSGLRGSGVELRNVVYRGRKVLARAHVPILNVKYKDNACGPYRDWQYQESMLQAVGTDVAPGFRLASQVPTTILQSGNDTGNFLGTAVYRSGEEVTLMAELEAGWYRYISQWTLHTDGTIKPRFGFAAVQDSCVCNQHYHHAYWRFDFDIGEPGNNVVQESSGNGWRTIGQETKAFRDARFAKRWRVGNRSLRAMYEIRPNIEDGRAQASPDWPFPVGDLWFLRRRDGEIDDGVTGTTGNVEVQIDRFVQRESLVGTDLVVWYAGHFIHDEGGAEESGGHGHVVGPDLVPVNW